MRINFFEGGRRIMFLISALIALTGLYIVYDSSPSLKLIYEVPFFNEPALRLSGDSCSSYNDAEVTKYSDTPEGHSYTQIICFKAHKSGDGSQVIPYKIDEATGTWWGNMEYSDEVKSYTQTYSNAFREKDADVRSLDESYWKVRAREISKGLGITAGIILAFTLSCSILGWIVRGFAGIPLGRDFKD